MKLFFIFNLIQIFLNNVFEDNFMKKNLKKIVVSLFLIFTCLGLVYASGWHIASEVLSGTFLGNYEFNGSVQVNSEPVNPNDVATKNYVDAASSSGTTTYVLKGTTASYSGNLGGYSGMRDKCQAEFGEDSFVFNSIFLESVTKGMSNFIIDVNMGSAFWWQGLGLKGGLLDTGYDVSNPSISPNNWYQTGRTQQPNCRGWTSSGPGHYGSSIVSSGSSSGVPCHNTYSILCVDIE